MKEGMIEGRTSPCCNGHHTLTGSAASSAYLSLIFRASGERETAILLQCCHCTAINNDQTMTKTELQVALAAATETNKRTAGIFLDTLCDLAYKATKKNGEFVLPGFGKLVKQKRKARSGFNPKTQQKIKIPAKTVVKFRVAKAAKDAILGVKK
jgi:DNA-binding protein HU-beta